MCLRLCIRLLFVYNLLHVGELFKCSSKENEKNLRARNRWSQWSDWSPCTRPCGIGLQHRNRTCLNTRRRRRNKGCAGASFVVRLCNTQDCSDDRPDLLSEQCAAFNNRTFAGRRYTWLPFLHLGRECSLHCRPQGERFFAELSPLAADGTPCANNSYCYKGRCLEAGCNDILGYNGKADCEMCDRKNTSYHRISGLFTRQNLNYGYSYVATIPNPARNITIRHLKSSRNHLALKKNSGPYILNGDWNINHPGLYKGCGTTFTYHREADQKDLINEYIQSPGPLQEPVQLMILVVEENTGISYEYEVPISDESTFDMLDSMNEAALQSKNSVIQHRVHRTRNETTFINNQIKVESYVHRRRHRNRHFSWKQCFKSCGGVVHKSTVCIRQSNEMIVSEHRCSALDKPLQEDYRCDSTKICLPEWISFEWSSCSVTCGEGVQKRDVICKQFTSTGHPITVSNGACLAPPPLTIQKCNMKPCDTVLKDSVDWEAGPWSECSSTCGHGMRTRQVVCRSPLCPVENAPTTKESCYTSCKTGASKWLMSQLESECPQSCGDGWRIRNVICFGGDCNRNERPDNYISCSSDVGCSGEWFAGPWQKCSGICQTGEQRRDIVCMAKVHNQFEVVPDNKCIPERKPTIHQRCQLPKCTAMWYATNWSMCSSSCGGGMQYREVFCIENNAESTLCQPEEKPSTSQRCNTNACTNSIEGTGCEDKHHYCSEAVVQARLCLYQYYKILCCQACYYNKI